MTAAGAALFVVVLVFALLLPLALYVLVRAERDQREEEGGRSERSERDLENERGA